MLKCANAIVIDINAITIATLSQSQFEFMLTGSRYFGGSHELSDYDFFTKNSEEVENWLRQQGFNNLPKWRKYQNCCDVVKVLERGKVQVQLVNNAELKEKIQNLLLTRGVLSGCSKEERRKMWQLAYDCAKITNVEIKHDSPPIITEPVMTEPIVEIPLYPNEDEVYCDCELCRVGLRRKRTPYYG